MTEETHDNDLCTECKQVEGPNHEHICPGCGAVCGPSALNYGDDAEPNPIIVCDQFCLHEFDPDNKHLRHIPEEVWEAGREKRKVKQEMNLLKQRAAKAGVPWI